MLTRSLQTLLRSFFGQGAGEVPSALFSLGRVVFLRRRLPSCPTGATMIKSRRKAPAAKTSLLSEQKQRKHEDGELQKAAARGAAFEKCLSRKFTSRVHRRRKEKLTRRKKISYIAVKGYPRIRVWLEIFFFLLCFCSVVFSFSFFARYVINGQACRYPYTAMLWPAVAVVCEALAFVCFGAGVLS